MRSPLSSAPGLTRRQFLAASAAAAAAGPLSLGAAPGRPPNVLFIICDDYSAGVLDHPQVRAPHLERLAARSLRFDNAHCASPLCNPGRSALFTGISPVTSGLYGYKQQLNPMRQNPVLARAESLMERFTRAGYDVMGAGKIWHNGHEDQSVWRRADRRPAFEVAASFGPMPWDGAGRNDKGWIQHPDLPPPLNDVTKSNWDLSWASLEDVPRVPENFRPGTPGHVGWWDLNRPFRYEGPDDRDRMPDERVADWCIERLAAPAERPFFLACGFNRPHTPLVLPQEYFDRFPRGTIRATPATRADDLDDCAPTLRPGDRLDLHDTGYRRYANIQAAGGDELMRHVVGCYLAGVSFVDDQLGRVLDALEQSPHARDTIVVFTADHGYHLGEKDQFFKATPWDPSTRVPLILHVPGRRAGRTAHAVSAIDVHPTLVAACGFVDDGEDRPNRRGHSLLPFFDDPTGATFEGPEAALTSVHSHAEIPLNTKAPADLQHHTLRTAEWRYIRTRSGEEEFYDLANDPHEWHNLAADPAHRDRVAACRETLAQRLKALA